MARIRTIKPEYWSSPDTAACDDPWARLLYIAMWNWADDCGRGTANVRELGGFAFPNDEWISNDDIRRMLGGIRRAFGVEFYKVDGRPYYAIPSWENHQKIDKRSGARHPAPDDAEQWDPEPPRPRDLQQHNHSAGSAEPSTDPAESPPSPRRAPGAGTGEQGNRGTGENTHAPAPDDAAPDPPAEPPERFAEFYDAYPRHKDRRAAEKAWRAALKRGADPAAVIVAAHHYAEQTRATEARYVKYPASWLNAAAYDDEPEPARPQLRAVSGGYQPYRNPTDPSVWHEPLLPPNSQENP